MERIVSAPRSWIIRALIAPPAGRLGPVSPQERQVLLDASPVRGLYDRSVDRDSAYEQLLSRAASAAKPPEEAPALPRRGAGGREAPSEGEAPTTRARGRQPEGMGTALAKSMLRSVGSSVGRQIGQQIIRGVLGSLFRSR